LAGLIDPTSASLALAPLPGPPGRAEEAALPAPAGAHGSESQLLMPVMQQFHLMQQQMFDQFHQTMLLMFRMFTTMHQDQVALIRQELQHIQRANEDLKGLQAELRAATANRKAAAQRTDRAERAPPGPAPAPPAPRAPKAPATQLNPAVPRPELASTPSPEG